MFITAIIIMFFAALVLGAIATPFILAANRGKLRKMEETLANFEKRSVENPFSSDEERDRARRTLKATLLSLKRRMIRADKMTTGKAQDLLDSLTF